MSEKAANVQDHFEETTIKSGSLGGNYMKLGGVSKRLHSGSTALPLSFTLWYGCISWTLSEPV